MKKIFTVVIAGFLSLPSTDNIAQCLITRTISGPSQVCPPGATGIVYTTEAGMSLYSWVVTNGTITAGGTTTDHTVTVTAPASGGMTIQVQYTDTNGCRPPSFMSAVKSVSVASTVQTATISGNLTPCQNAPGNVYTTEAGKTNYQWMVPPFLAAVTGGGGTTDNYIEITWLDIWGPPLRVSYSEPSGCIASGMVFVSAQESPNYIDGPPTTCSGVVNSYSTAQSQSSYAWSVSAGGTIVSGGSATDYTIGVRWNLAGPKTISVLTTSSSGCTPPSPAVLNVAVSASPLPTISGNSIVCAYTENTYTTEPGKSNYNWNLSPGTQFLSGWTTNSITVLWPQEGARYVSVNYYEGSCWAASPTVLNVTVNPQPFGSISGSDGSCPGIENVYTTQPGMTNYAWNLMDIQTMQEGTVTAGGTPTNNSITIIWNTPGYRLLQVSYNNSFGCSGTIPKTVNVGVAPARVISMTPPVCLGATELYSTTPGMTAYNWTVTGGTITAGGNTNLVTVLWTQGGSQTIGIYYIDPSAPCNNPMPTTSTVTVNVPVPVVASVTGNSSACNGSFPNMYTTEALGSNYVWTVTGGINHTGNGLSQINIEWTTSGDQTVSVAYNTSNCASPAAGSKIVSIVALTPPTITGIDRPCLNTQEGYTTQMGMTGYSWTVNGGTITAGGTSTDHTATILWTAPNGQSVSVSFANGSGCTASLQKVIFVRPYSIPSLTSSPASPTICQGTGQTFLTQNGAYQYSWSFSPGGVVIGGGTVNNSWVDIRWDMPGQKTVSVNYGSTFLCPSLTPPSITLDVLESPTPTITGPVVACQFDPNNIFTTESDKPTYDWSVPAGTIVSGAGTHSITVKWNGTGPQIVRANYYNSNGCYGQVSAESTIQVNAAPTPAITGNPTACVNSPGNLYSTDTGKSDYVWSIPPGATITAGGTTIDPTVTVTWNNVAYETITINYKNGQGCAAPMASTKNVSVQSLPVPYIGANKSCLEAGNIYSTSSGGSNYSWVVSAGGTITAGGSTSDYSVTLTWNTTGPKSVSVNYTDGYGCTGVAAAVKNFTITTRPVPTITGETAICPGLTKSYSTELSNTDYLWWVDYVPYTLYAGSSSCTVAWTAAGPHLVTVSYVDANGCLSMAGNKNIQIGNLPQTITFNPLSNIAYANPLNLNPATASTGLPITYLSSNTAVASGGPRVYINGVGTSTITATQPGNLCYAPAPNVLRTLNVVKGSQTITFNSLAAKVYTNPPFTLTATSSVFLPVSFSSSNTSVATISGNTVTIIGAGSSVITASQAGNAFYNPAPSVNRTLTVNKMSQAITFGTLPPTTVGNVFVVSATSTSGLAVTFSSSNTAKATVSGNNVTALAAGTVNITASQAGNANWLAAPNVPRSLTIYAVPQISGPTTWCGASITLSTIPATSYLWSTGATTPTISVTSSGNFTVAVTNAGYTSTSNTHVVADGRPTVTVLQRGTPPQCNLKTILTSSVAGSSYQWYKAGQPIGLTTQSIEASTYGYYSVKVTNPTGCNGQAATSAEVFADAPVYTSVLGPKRFCQGSSTRLETGEIGNGPHAYLWSNGATQSFISVSTPGYYSAVVTNTSTGCTFTTSTAQVDEIYSTNGAYIVPGECTPFTGEITLTAHPEGSSYAWYKDGVLYSTSGPTITAIGGTSVVTNFSVSIGGVMEIDEFGWPYYTNAEGCLDLPACLYYLKAEPEPSKDKVDKKVDKGPDRVAEKSVTFELESSTEWIVYPNPAGDELNIVLPRRALAKVRIELIDQVGKSVVNSTIAEGERSATLNTTDLAPTVYLLKLEENSITTYKRVVITH